MEIRQIGQVRQIGKKFAGRFIRLMGKLSCMVEVQG
jgi:hypothetical protein